MEKRQREGGIRTWQKILTAYFSTSLLRLKNLHSNVRRTMRLKKNFIQSMDISTTIESCFNSLT